MGKKLRGVFLYLLFSSLLGAVYPSGVMAQLPNTWINEIHLQPEEVASPLRVEVAVKNPDSLDLSSLFITLYDREGEPFSTVPVSGSFEQGESVDGFVFFYGEIPEAVALSLDYQGGLIHLISTIEGFEAASGPASGVEADYAGIQPSGASQDLSLQLAGAGDTYADFSWTGSETSSLGAPGERQYFHTVVQFGEPVLSASEAGGAVSIPVYIDGPDSNQVIVQVSLQETEGYAGREDFIGEPSGTVTFFEDASDGETLFIRLDLYDDDIYEGEERALFGLSVLSTGGSAQPGEPDTLEVVIEDNDRPDIVINEIMADPDSDADRNGSRDDSYDDQFIELLNNEPEPVDISGWTISDNGSDVRFTFPPGTVIPPSGGVVLFSRDADGSPAGLFGDAQVFISDVPLALDRSGDTPTLRNQDGIEVDSYNYSAEANNGQSIVRNPDGNGLFVLHGEAGDTGLSPGTKIDGSNFLNSVIIQGEEGWRLLSVPASGLTVARLGSGVSIQGYPGYAPGQSKSFFTGYNGTSFTDSEDVNNGTLTTGSGFLLYFSPPVGSTGAEVSTLLDATSGVTEEIDVNVDLHSEGDRLNLLGNPFDTALDLSDIESWVNGNGALQSSVGQFWDSESQSFVLTTLNNNLVPPWHGFFLKNGDASGLTIPLSARADGSAAGSSVSREGYMALTLRGTGEESEAGADRAALIYFNEEAEYGLDSYDAEKLLPFSNRYALLSFRGLREETGTPVSLAQDARPFNFEGDLSYNVDLTVQDMSGQFILSWQREELPDSWNFTLIDNQTGNQIDMNNRENYAFVYNPNSSSPTTVQAASEAPGNTIPETMTLDPPPGGPSRFTIRVSVGNAENQTAVAVEPAKLNPNYPNPFNPTTVISFELTEPAEVHLNVYTIVGQRVATLVDGMREAGMHEVIWSAPELPSGIYIAQLEVEGEVFIRKMTLIK